MNKTIYFRYVLSFVAGAMVAVLVMFWANRAQNVMAIYQQGLAPNLQYSEQIKYLFNCFESELKKADPQLLLKIENINAQYNISYEFQDIPAMMEKYFPDYKYQFLYQPVKGK